MSKLIIVESPTKARTISHFVGKDFKIESSFGHIRDLPENEMGIDIANNFEPRYVIPQAARKRVTSLEKLAMTASTVILATDEDREGEAIAWHLSQALGLLPPHPSSPSRGEESKEEVKKLQRIVFHEITRPAIEEALKNPRAIDLKLVDAQQARRILDRLVGYELSPFLWKKVRAGLSAGRVQSVALRFVVEREREIENHKPQEYWIIEAKLKKKEAADSQSFKAKLVALDGKLLKKLDIKTKAQADQVLKALDGTSYQVTQIEKKELKRFPAPPFTTSTLQQEASRKLGLSAKQTMAIAQELYETGYITYMRTDSVNLSEQALRQAQGVIREKFGLDYVLPSPRRYKTKSKGAQEAHEAIRPTNLQEEAKFLAEKLEPRLLKLYSLIWKRMIACQMPEANFDQTVVDISTTPSSSPPIRPGRTGGERVGVFRASGQVLKFDGFIKVYTEGRDENGEKEKQGEGKLPPLTKGEILDLLDLAAQQNFTQPPSRYTDASLVKTLEEYGIGRPSTYAPTISTILERSYVERISRKFQPTEIGKLVNDLLVEHFPQIVDYKFTARMEEELDEIAEGKRKWQPVIKEFYEPFKKNLETKKTTVEKQVTITTTPCPHCGKMMVKKFGRYGQFLACPQPGSRVTLPLPEEAEKLKRLQEENKNLTCPKCGKPMQVRRGKYGYFLGCTDYPNCKGLAKIWNKVGFKCPNCQAGELVEKRARGQGRVFYACNRYPECVFLTNKKPVTEEELQELWQQWKENPPRTRKSKKS